MSNNFITSISIPCQEVYKNGGNLLPSVSIAQAILESGWGKSTLAVKGNNLFGIKGAYEGKWITLNTKEYINGNWITVQANFRKYPSFYESILDHDNLINNTRYKSVKISKDYKEQCKQLQASGYATDPNYANLLIQIIDENNLTKYDNFQTVKFTKQFKTFRIVTDVLNVRSKPNTTSNIVAKYYKNETVNTDSYCDVNGYRWRHYKSYNNKDRYIAEKMLNSKTEIYMK